ncbi:MAG: EF-hand domain-containing protein [Thermodesulforhabdaceae bacterium]|jgi:Ca2+-binding EF-hand superfamily protein
MKRLVAVLMALALVVVFGVGAASATEAQKPCPDTFKALDKNGDGKLSVDEFKAGGKDNTEDAFKAKDANKDGALTVEEMCGAAKK